MKIFANFKMNQTQSQTKEYLMNFIPKINDFKSEVTLCLPFTSLPVAHYLIGENPIKLGAQNISDKDSGALTGEVSGAMLKDVGVETVIIGHSERRSKFKENAKLINQKIKTALKNGLTVVLCIGETLAEKNTLKTPEILKEQIEDALKGLYENELENIIIAYEPIWAIGTGQKPTNKEIEKSIKEIRNVITNDFSVSAGEKINVLYGGSVNSKNVDQIKKSKGLDGFLIGGACLDVNHLLQILTLVNN